MTTQENDCIDEILFDLCDISYADFIDQKAANDFADRKDIERSEARQAIEAYVTTRVKEAERLQETERMVDYLSKIIGLTGEPREIYAELIRRSEKRIESLTTTTNGKSWLT